LSELVLTAYDVQKYLREALPAMKAAIYRGDLSHAKDVLALYDDTIYDEYDLSIALVDDDYSWIFTPDAANTQEKDPPGTLIGLTYPLILAYHHPDVFRMVIGGSELDSILPFAATLDTAASNGSASVPIEPGFREGLRAMWEIIGFLTPEGTQTLQAYCQTHGYQKALSKSASAAKIVDRLANGLTKVIERGYGLVIERD
jgi:hypothetical protein